MPFARLVGSLLPNTPGCIAFIGANRLAHSVARLECAFDHTGKISDGKATRSRLYKKQPKPI